MLHFNVTINHNVADTNSSQSTNEVPFVLFSIVGFGVLGNSLVCAAIVAARRLRNPTNFFLCSLAVADLFVCSIIMPTAILTLVKGSWMWGEMLCIAYVTLDVFLSSVSILHMTMIAVDRCWGISRPLTTRHRRASRVTIRIILVWLSTTVLISPIVFVAAQDPSNVLRSGQCQIFHKGFQIYGSILTFYVPFAVMFLAFCQTIRALKAQTEAVTRLCEEAASTRRRTSCKNETTTKELLVRPSGYQEYTRPHSESLQSIKTYVSRNAGAILQIDTQYRAELFAQHNHLPYTCARRNSRLRNCWNSFSRFLQFTQLLQLKKKSESKLLRKERKATKVLGVVFASFFICWAPFFTLNITLALCKHCEAHIPQLWATTFLWLGYCSSTINPLIYTTFNSTFRTAMWRLIACRCADIITLNKLHTMPGHVPPGSLVSFNEVYRRVSKSQSVSRRKSSSCASWVEHNLVPNFATTDISSSNI